MADATRQRYQLATGQNVPGLPKLPGAGAKQRGNDPGLPGARGADVSRAAGSAPLAQSPSPPAIPRSERTGDDAETGGVPVFEKYGNGYRKRMP